MAASRLSGCPSVTVMPDGAAASSGAVTPKHADFSAVASAYADFNALRDGNQDFDSIAEGHPGYPGGPPASTAGTGVRWGWADGGAEWWITDAEGLDDSAPWDAAVTELAADDGGVVEAVRAAGRRITLRGRIVADNRDALIGAKRLAAAALAVQPRIGWLDYEGLRLPVALAGQTRVRHVGELAADVEMSLVGAEVGTPGGGVFFEGRSHAVALPWGGSQTIAVGGTVPSSPTITVVGPVPSGTNVTIAGAIITLTGELAPASTMTIDCRRRLVTIDGKPNRGAVTLNAWPLLSGAFDVSASTSSGLAPAGRVSVSATDLY